MHDDKQSPDPRRGAGWNGAFNFPDVLKFRERFFGEGNCIYWVGESGGAGVLDENGPRVVDLDLRLGAVITKREGHDIEVASDRRVWREGLPLKGWGAYPQEVLGYGRSAMCAALPKAWKAMVDEIRTGRATLADFRLSPLMLCELLLGVSMALADVGAHDEARSAFQLADDMFTALSEVEAA